MHRHHGFHGHQQGGAMIGSGAGIVQSVGIGGGAGVHFATEFFNPKTPVEVPVNGFLAGQRLRVVLVPSGHEDRFQINLKSPSDNLFHFNPRFDEVCVVRNSTRHGHWQQEERYADAFPFHVGKVYTLEFVATHGGTIAVYVNGTHFTEFQERESGAEVNLIEISGGVHVHSVHVTV